jgi:hypothetical protein
MTSGRESQTNSARQSKTVQMNIIHDLQAFACALRAANGSLRVRISASEPQSADRPSRATDIHTIPKIFLAIKAFVKFSIEVTSPDITLQVPTNKICSAKNKET